MDFSRGETFPLWCLIIWQSLRMSLRTLHHPWTVLHEILHKRFLTWMAFISFLTMRFSSTSSSSIIHSIKKYPHTPQHISTFFVHLLLLAHASVFWAAGCLHIIDDGRFLYVHCSLFPDLTCQPLHQHPKKWAKLIPDVIQSPFAILTMKLIHAAPPSNTFLPILTCL